MLKQLALFSLIFVSGTAMALTLTSPAFKNGQRMPIQFTCEDVNHSPPLHWRHAPPNTQSFILIVEDPDAPMGTWNHWILYNIPASTTSLAKNVKVLPLGTQVGRNSWGHASYGGPCPPNGEHRYFFKLYALDTTLKLPNGANKADIETAMQQHVLGSAQLIAKYARK